MTKIGIAEDHPLFREAFSAFCIQSGFDVVVSAKDGIDLIEKLCSNPLPNVIFMDIRMPRMNGIEATTVIRQTYPTIKVIALSNYEHEKHIIDMLNCGAAGYLKKSADKEEIFSAIEYVKNEELYYPEKMLNNWNIPVNYLENCIKKRCKTSLLNDREYQFISHCASDDSYQQIADKMGVAYRTINCYRDSTFKKLKIASRAGLALYAVLNGLSDLIDSLFG